MKLSGQFGAIFFFFFTKKVLNTQKHSRVKIKQTLNNKDNNFSPAQKLLRGWKLFALHFGAFCACVQNFLLKKVNWLEIVLKLCLILLYYLYSILVDNGISLNISGIILLIIETS